MRGAASVACRRRARVSAWAGKLKRETADDLIAYGGATFAQALSRAGLVDAYRLVIQPAALGAGLPMFRHQPTPLFLELAEAHTYPTGTAIQVYRPRHTA